jgi:hypothetical protein
LKIVEFKSGLKILITFGFVDLEGHYNKEKNMKKCAEGEKQRMCCGSR